MRLGIWALFFGLRFIFVVSQSYENGNGYVFIDGKSGIGRTDSDFICATLDWWPPEKCDYGTCSWGHASLLNLDLNNNIFLNAIQAFSPLKIRLGGSLQDKLIYETKDHEKPCIPFARNTSESELFGFNQGCLPLSRWDELNAFFKKSGAVIIFGLNALNGRSIQDHLAVGAWDPTNAKSLMSYTVEKNYTIHGWELGNELSGTGVGVRVAADQYAFDTIAMQTIVQDVYKEVEPKPQIIAPGGFFDEYWFKEFTSKTPQLDVVTHHIYNLGAGVDTHLVDRILNPSYLDGMADTFSKLHNILNSSGTSAVAWVGEAGGAYNSGHNLVTNSFVFSFWYLDQLGMSATYDTKTYCRQTLIGGNYGLLNTTNFLPNPDYYSALLWHRLMGRDVLSTSFTGTKKIRTYAHCAKNSKGVTLLLINLDNNSTVEAKLIFNGTLNRHHHHQNHNHNHKGKIIRPMKGSGRTREEYHLTAENGNLHSQTMVLNGKPLTVNSSCQIPALEPIIVNSSEPITVAPFSIVFVHIPYVVLPACKEESHYYHSI